MALVVLAALCTSDASAKAPHPHANRSLSAGTVSACSADPSGSSCTTLAHHGSRFTITGALQSGTWTVRAVLLGSAGWRDRTYVIKVRIQPPSTGRRRR